MKREPRQFICRGLTGGSDFLDRGLCLHRVASDVQRPRILDLSPTIQATAASLPMTVGNAMKLDIGGAILLWSLWDGGIALLGSTGDQRHMTGLFGRSQRGWCA
jgi:hypothetical protein